MLRNPPYLVGIGSAKTDGPPLYAELGHPSPESTGFEAKEVGRTGRPFDSPTSMLKDANDVFLLHFLEARNRRGRLIQRLFKTIDYSKDASLTVYHRTLDDVCQLPDVSRPGVSLQILHCAGGHRVYRFAEFFSCRLHEVFYQQGDVFSSMSERR